MTRVYLRSARGLGQYLFGCHFQCVLSNVQNSLVCFFSLFFLSFRALIEVGLRFESVQELHWRTQLRTLYDLRMYYCDRCWIALEPERELSCDDLKDELIHLFVSIPILLHPEIIERGLTIIIRKHQKPRFCFKKQLQISG